MTESSLGAWLAGRVGSRAARALASEFVRLPNPKSGIVVGADARSTVLSILLDALMPGDTLTVVVDEPHVAEVSTAVREHGDWLIPRVTVVSDLEAAKPAHAVVLAQPMTGNAEQAAHTVATLRELLLPGGVLSLAVPARPALAGSAGEEIIRQAGAYGVGSDLVLRNLPALRVHRLRFTTPDLDQVDQLIPAYRPSSVPLTRGMHIDSNGLAAAGVCLTAAALLRRIRPIGRLWLVPALAALPVAAFFRDPERLTPDDPDAVVAASDGKVLAVERLTDDRLASVGVDQWLRISVFLSILDVHINRAPVAGRVVDVIREPGGYAPAMKPAAEHNVAAYTVLETPRGPVAVAQRTGLVARRIVNRTRPGMLLAKGERYGLIRFGSRTDVYLPADAARPLVAPNDRVVGGSTVIARWVDTKDQNPGD